MERPIDVVRQAVPLGSITIMKSMLFGALLALGCVASASAADYKWGALSVDTTKLNSDAGYGVGGGDTEAEAECNAQTFYSGDGARGCKVVLTYRQCGALAVPSSGASYGWAKAATEQAAKAGALEVCNERSCKIVASDCN